MLALKERLFFSGQLRIPLLAQNFLLRFPLLMARFTRLVNAPQDGFTQEGDVILALAPPFSCACIGPDEAGAFIPNSCAVIRMNQATRAMLDPWYLAGFLALPATQKALHSKRAGGKTALLTIDQVCDLTLLVPDMTQQKLLGEAVRQHAQLEIALKRFQESEMRALSSAYAHVLQKDGNHD